MTGAELGPRDGARHSPTARPEMMRFEVFTDPLYHRERHVEFEASEVADVRERDARLFGRGKFRVTEITLRTGLKYLLRGEVADQIRAAQEPSAPEGSE